MRLVGQLQQSMVSLWVTVAWQAYGMWCCGRRLSDRRLRHWPYRLRCADVPLQLERRVLVSRCQRCTQGCSGTID